MNEDFKKMIMYCDNLRNPEARLSCVANVDGYYREKEFVPSIGAAFSCLVFIVCFFCLVYNLVKK